MMNVFIVFTAINQLKASVPNLIEECILQCLNDTDDVNESNIPLENETPTESKSLARKRQSTPKLFHDDAKRLRNSRCEDIPDTSIANIQIHDAGPEEVSNKPCESLSNDFMQNESLQFSQQVKSQVNSRLIFNFTSFKDFRTNYAIKNSFITSQPPCTTANETAEPSKMKLFDPENDLIDCITALEIDLYSVNEDDDLIRHLRSSVYSNDKKPFYYCLVFTNTDNKKYVDKILDFLKNYQNDENIVYQQIQELYIFFIAKKCLTYDFKLAVHKFNSNLWGIHRYCIEFYSYIIWTFEEIAANNARYKEHEEEYKKHLIQEMIYIDQIIDLYGQLIPAAGEVKESLQSQLFDVIHDMRNETMTYLNKFCPFENITHFYTIICAISFGSQRPSVIQYAGKEVVAKPNASKNPIGSALAVKDVKTNIRNHLHCSITNTAFLLAFTANFSYFKYADFVASIKSDNNAGYSNPGPTGLDIVLRQYRSIFQVAVVNTLKFVAATRIKDLLINTPISEIELKIFFLNLVVEANKIFVSRSAHFILRHIQAIILQSMGYRSIGDDQEINS